jgi:Fe-S-cluster containining protein
MYVELDHPRFAKAELEVFTRRVVADCMTHQCSMHATGAPKLDACCQYGADVDLGERDRIRARAADIRPILRADARDLPWFDESKPERDADMPSGTMVRTAKHDGGCIFLAHDRRGCAIHRASVEQGWDYRGTKPMVCRLFPLTFGAPADGGAPADDPSLAILVSDDYEDYSCAYDANAPTLYEVARDALADIFGAELVRAMDAAAARVKARHLPTL